MPLEDQPVEEGQLAKDAVLMDDLESGGGHPHMMDGRLNHSAAWGATGSQPTLSRLHPLTRGDRHRAGLLGCGRRLL